MGVLSCSRPFAHFEHGKHPLSTLIRTRKTLLPSAYEATQHAANMGGFHAQMDIPPCTFSPRPHMKGIYLATRRQERTQHGLVPLHDGHG